MLIRSSRAIEILAKVATIVCDEAGTLTIDHAGVNDIDTMSDRFGKEEVLCYAASAEKGLTHPITEAIVHHAKDTGVALKDCEEWEYKIGLGASVDTACVKSSDYYRLLSASNCFFQAHIFSCLYLIYP